MAVRNAVVAESLKRAAERSVASSAAAAAAGELHSFRKGQLVQARYQASSVGRFGTSYYPGTVRAVLWSG